MEGTMETACQWRYYVGAIKVIVPEGTPLVAKGDSAFRFEGYLGAFESAEIPLLLQKGYLRRRPQ
ncbi:hypothetical protein HY417_02025 [Candidatus Kaiserbacteria bacterium]|nr:hypothetical protein [Candidatus Kaiserbacteria bacterium]